MAYPSRVSQSTIIAGHIGFADELVDNWPWPRYGKISFIKQR